MFDPPVAASMMYILKLDLGKKFDTVAYKDSYSHVY